MSFTSRQLNRYRRLLGDFNPRTVAPAVPPVPAGTVRPLWSVMIPTFNCAQYLRQTLESVLAQDPGPERMQIEVVDDVSTKDDPEAIVREIGRGRVSFFRKAHNEGATANFNTCIARSNGHLVHILHGDDFVEAGFYARMAAAAQAYPETAAFFVRCRVVEEDGTLDYVAPRLRRLATPTRSPAELLNNNGLFTPGVVVRRSLYEAAGGFLPALVHTADWEMWVRAIATGGGLWLNELLADYRFFAANDTQRLARTAENLRDRLRAGWIFTERYPEFDGEAFARSLSWPARRQMQRFVALGDVDAVAANRVVYHGLAGPALRRVHAQWEQATGMAEVESAAGARQRMLVVRSRAARARKREVWIWGAGQAGLVTLRKLQAADVGVAAFIDSDPRKQGQVVESIPIRGPGELATGLDRPFVVIASMYAVEIEQCLQERKFRPSRDYAVS